MIRAPRNTRSRKFPLSAFLGAAIAAAGIACAKDALVTSPLKVPQARTLDVSTSPPGIVVISQVYGGGGNSGAKLKNDFIELHNIGSGDAVLDGWSVQYASSGGVSWAVTPLSGTLQPGQFYLVKEAPGAGGTDDLPSAEATGSIAMSATSGKVALVGSTAPLSCGTSANRCTALAQVVDLVGYGSSASDFEGAGPTATLANTTAALRNGGGCTDTDSNSNDFSVGTPAPRNNSVVVRCPEVAPRVSRTVPAAGGELGDDATISVRFSEPVTVGTDWLNLTCSATGAHIGTTSGGATTFTLTGLGDFAPGETCTATVAAGAINDIDADDPPDVMNANFAWTFKIAGAPIVLPDTRFSEIHYDNSSDDVNEQIEIEGPANTDLYGWSVVLYNGGSGTVYDQRSLSGTIPATCGDRGVVVVPFATIQNGSPDGFALVHNSEVVQFLSYEGSFTAADGPAAGMSSTDIRVEEGSSTSAISSLQLNGTTGRWSGPSRRSFGRCNKDGPPPFDITFTGRLPISDPPLPVSFEDQLFATLVDLSGAQVTTTFTWTSETPSVASIDQRGVMHALEAGQAVFRATAANGTSATYSLPTAVATLGGTADYRGNAEFGIPVDGDPSDDFIISREQYTLSYNHNRNTPNWVSYEFDATHFGANDRCECFTHDPALPSTFTHLTTADYTGAGEFAGYGIDRGHMARSFDLTTGTLDNARSFYLSNVIPQASAVNQGPWKLLEDYLGNLARFQDKEVYVIAGVAGNKGSVKGEGKIVIPSSVWKVALILPRDHGLADVKTFRDIDDVIAVIMPNDKNVDSQWETYKTSVDEVERLSGYDLLALLPDKLERSVENNDIVAAWHLDAATTAARALAGLSDGEINSLVAKISAAQDQLAVGSSTPAVNQLRSLLNELSALTRSGRLADGDIASLRSMIEDLIRSIA